jgi:prephenate dehydrogenase
MISRLCIIGVGLIGGSLALALKRAGAVDSVIGCGRQRANLELARSRNVIDEFTTDPGEAVRDADVVVMAAPLGAAEPLFRAIRGNLAPQAIVTDVGSAKRCVVEDAKRVFGAIPANFVPGHPIAGTEQSGVEAAFESLFDDHRVILTPLEETDARATQTVRLMWEAAGAEVLLLDLDHHDQVLAATSHLPHMLAYTLVDTLGRMEQHTEIFRYAAGGFRDFTRIASSDPTMWHDICLANKDALLNALQQFSADLAVVSDAIRNSDSAVLKDVFSRAKDLRDAHVSGSK